MVSKIKKIKTMEQLGNTHNTLTCDGSCKQKTRFVGYKMGAIGSSFLVFFSIIITELPTVCVRIN